MAHRVRDKDTEVRENEAWRTGKQESEDYVRTPTKKVLYLVQRNIRLWRRLLSTDVASAMKMYLCQLIVCG